jgi:dUTP pyrophosphatase
MNERFFEVAKGFENDNPTIPTRKTALSAGYDIEALGSAKIAPGKMLLINTGLKAKMPSDEYLALHIRSSLAINNKLILINCTGIVDADYYGNEKNDGHIMLALFNLGDETAEIINRERIAQGIFTKYSIVDDDNAVGKRKGGMGSTGKK